MEHLKRISYIWYWISGAIGYAIGGHDMSFYMLMIAMALDTLFWCLKALRFDEFNSSDAMWWTIAKVLMLIILMFFNHMSKSWFSTSFITHWVGGLLWFLTRAEVVSVIQNYLMIRTGEKIKERDAVTEIWNVILDSIRSALQSIKKKWN